LRAVRAKDSNDKRQSALAAVESLERAGAPVTFTSVANTAGVSSWLVRAEGIREHVEAARRRQVDHGVIATVAVPGRHHQATPASLRTDLTIAQEQIKVLRAERDKLTQRLRLHLGAEIDGPDRAALIARVADLEAVNRRLVADRDDRQVQTDIAGRRVQELEDELVAVRESLRRVIRTENRGR
jgi:acyl-CoA hydrolase